MKATADVERRLRALLTEIAGVGVIGPATRVFHDLWIGGDDASELMETIAEEFAIDMEGFDFGRFFPDETEALGEHWAGRLRRSKRAPLTVEHLTAVARAGRWLDPA